MSSMGLCVKILIAPFYLGVKYMDEMTSRYLLAMDELNVLTKTSYYMTESDDIDAKIKQITDDVLSFLIRAYRLGIENASTMLGHRLVVDTDDLEEAIYCLIDGKDFKDRVVDHILHKDLQGLQVLVESEFHRIYNTALFDGAKQYESLWLFGITKTWETVRDKKVRDTHIYLDGMTIDLDSEFFTYDGDHALYPGGFRKAENNVNCRCIIVISKK